jgi:penicillin-binding protein 1C
VPLKIAGGVGRLSVLVNGVPVADPHGRRTLYVRPAGRGFVRLTVMDTRGSSDSVVVRLQ